MKARAGWGRERWRSDAPVKIAALARAASHHALAGRAQPSRSLREAGLQAAGGRWAPRPRGWLRAAPPQPRPERRSAPGNFARAGGDSRGRGCEAAPARSRRRVQLDSPGCSDMLAKPEMFEISGVSSPRRDASDAAGEHRESQRARRSETCRMRSGQNPSGLPVVLPVIAAPDDRALASKPLHTDEWLVGGAASGAARAGNWLAQRSARRGIPRDRSRIGGGTGLAAHRERMLPRRRVEPLSEERTR